MSGQYNAPCKTMQVLPHHWPCGYRALLPIYSTRQINWSWISRSQHFPSEAFPSLLSLGALLPRGPSAAADLRPLPNQGSSQEIHRILPTLPPARLMA